MESPPPLQRSKRLHNFTLPYLRWGQQRSLRCVKLPHHPSSSSSPSPEHAVQRSPAAGLSTSNSALRFGSVGEIAVGNGNPGLHLRYDAKAKVSGLCGGDDGARNAGVSAARPWNLRTRRAACYEPRDEAARNGDSPGRQDAEGDGYKEKKEKVKFSVPLLREEIEEDFAAMIGKRPPRRPKKRPRMVQKQLNCLFPGLWLTEEVTADSYNVPEILET